MGESEPIETFSILTTSTRAALTGIHHGQPSILEPRDIYEWLAPDSTQNRLLVLAHSAYEGPYESWRVSRRANNAGNDDPDLLLPRRWRAPTEPRS